MLAIRARRPRVRRPGRCAGPRGATWLNTAGGVPCHGGTGWRLGGDAGDVPVDAEGAGGPRGERGRGVARHSRVPCSRDGSAR